MNLWQIISSVAPTNLIRVHLFLIEISTSHQRCVFFYDGLCIPSIGPSIERCHKVKEPKVRERYYKSIAKFEIKPHDREGGEDETWS